MTNKSKKQRQKGFTLIDIKARRKALGLSQVELSKLSGVSQSCICKVETYSDCSVDVYAKILSALGYQLTVSLKGVK